MTAKEEIQKRQAILMQQRGDMALEHMKHGQRMKDLEQNILVLDLVIRANDMALRDMDTEAAIEAAKQSQEVKPNE